MKHTWRAPLERSIEEHYIQRPDEWYQTTVSPSGLLDITIISEHWNQLSFAERKEQIHHLLQTLSVPLPTCFLSLHTPEEAVTLESTRPLEATSPKALYSWFDLAVYAADATETTPKPQRELRTPSTTVFYSFKGGIGKTVSLAHAATLLARRGRKVVVVDLDIESPGLSSALNIIPPPHGLVDFFYERFYMPDETEFTIFIEEIFSEVSLANALGRLFVVPAGNLDFGYLAKIDDLRTHITTRHGEDLWSTFHREITAHLQPDIILVDSRAGLNEWAAFSLLGVADKAIAFLYPDEQNFQGMRFLTEALAGILPMDFVFSRVPTTSHKEMAIVKQQWNILRSEEENIDVIKSSTEKVLNNNFDVTVENATDRAANGPIVIPHLANLALANTYPIEELLPYYTPIANIIDEDI